VRHVMRKTLKHYVPEQGRKVNLWSFVVEPMEFFEDIQETSLKVAKACMEAGLEGCRDELIGADRHARGGKRSDSRNGYSLRKVFQTAIGRIQGLKIPRCRKRSLIRTLREQLERTRGRSSRRWWRCS